ncbi:unnamed protein product [Prunus armeniaca]
MKLGELPYGFLEETRYRGMVVNWCSQEKVFMHKAVACFMTHGGWSSTLETMASGVPVVVYLEWIDQPTNAKLLADVFTRWFIHLSSSVQRSSERFSICEFFHRFSSVVEGFEHEGKCDFATSPKHFRVAWAKLMTVCIAGLKQNGAITSIRGL